MGALIPGQPYTDTEADDLTLEVIQDRVEGPADATTTLPAFTGANGAVLTENDAAPDGASWTPPADTTTITSNPETGSYTLALGDAGKVVEVDSGTPADVTIPPNATVAFPVHTVIEVCQLGTGTVTIRQGSGVTIDGGEVVIVEQYGSVFLRKRATNEWVATASGSTVQPGELGAATTTTSFTQTGAGNSLVTGLTTTVTTGDRPVYITVSAKIQHTTAGSGVAVSIEEDGTQIADVGWTCPDNSAVSSISRTVRRTPSAGSHTYRVRITTTGTGDGVVVASSTSPALIAVEQR